jgi:hypothetical protein
MSERISRMRQSLEPRPKVQTTPHGCASSRTAGEDFRAKRQEGHADFGSAATGRGNPLKAKAQGRYRHETRPEKRGVEQGVKRLRKPEDAAQPGEANPV